MSDREREAREVFDVSDQFRIARKDIPEFKKFLESIKGTQVSLNLDIADILDDGQFINLVSLSGEQIKDVIIYATEEEKNAHPSLFQIAGVKWEQK